MKNFHVGDVFYGKSYVDMINKTIGTDFHSDIIKSCISLDRFGYKDLTAWFAFMNGETHGHRSDWKWRNYLLDNNTKIKEKLVSKNTEFYKYKRNEEGYLPYRLCFQIDPYNKGDKYCCKFVGLFRLTNFLKDDLTIMEYSKVSDDFCLKNISEYEYDEKFRKTLVDGYDKYKIPISKLGFSDTNYTILRNGNIKYTHELLEVGLDTLNKDFLNELRQKLYEVFKKDEKDYQEYEYILPEELEPDVTIKPHNKTSKSFILNKKMFDKDQIVIETVMEYVRLHLDIKIQELKDAFNFPNLSFTVIEDAKIAATQPNYELNYFYKEDESIPLVDGEVFVWKQWSDNDLDLFIENVKSLSLGIKIF